MATLRARLTVAYAFALVGSLIVFAVALYVARSARGIQQLGPVALAQGDRTLAYLRAATLEGDTLTTLRRVGEGPNNLRVSRTSADREAALLEQILAPALRSRNPERRKEAVEALENLAAEASHLKHLLLVRDLRRIAK